MEPSDLIALGVGSYAAIVATTALVWNILRERRDVTVSIKYAYGVGFLEGNQMVSIEGINNGHRPINIQEVGFMLANKTKLVNPTAQHNYGWLKDGDGTSLYIPKQDVDDINKAAKEEKARIVTAYVRDSTSRYYKCKISRRADWFNQ